MTLYFAYGSNMDRGQMARRCPSAVALGTAEIEGWRFIINSRGVATILFQPGRRVIGLLWRLTPACEASLDEYEGVAADLYRREWFDLPGHGRALVYTATDRAAGRPRPDYLEPILEAAREAAMPEDYVAELAAWGALACKA